MTKGTLTAAAPHMLPGFDVIRIFAALAVIFSHSYLLATGSEKTEPFQLHTGEILGIYGVFVFFILSGFLVTDSALRSRTLGSFALKRVRRIFPAFLAANILTAALVVPFFATEGAAAFLSDPKTWKTLLRVLTFQDGSLYYWKVAFYAPALEGQSGMTGVVNGVLWTIRVEVSCYVVVGLLMVTRLLRPVSIMVLAVLTTVLSFRYDVQVTPFLVGLSYTAPCFVAGMFLRIHAQQHRASGVMALYSALALALSMVLFPGWSRITQILFPIFAAYPLLWLGQRSFGRDMASGKSWNDPSYGIYIWGWPVQQVILSFTGPEIAPVPFMMLCLPATLAAGYLSWHFIEKPFLARAKPAKGLQSLEAGAS